MITKKDLTSLEQRLETNLVEKLEKRFEKKFATKKDLIALEIRLEKRLENKFATKNNLNTLEKRLENKFLTGFDQIMVELKAIREEQTVMFYQIQNKTDQLNDHGTRIGLLESGLNLVK